MVEKKAGIMLMSYAFVFARTKAAEGALWESSSFNLVYGLGWLAIDAQGRSHGLCKPGSARYLRARNMWRWIGEGNRALLGTTPHTLHVALDFYVLKSRE